MVRRRLVAAWRGLFVPPRPSQAMENFFGWLAETPHQWYIDSCGKIRARSQETEVCAVTGVAQHRTGVTFSVGDWLRAAEMIGLSYREAALIVAAADAAGSSGTRRNRLRAQLLVAARIQSSSAPAPARPVSMDRARADFFAARACADHLCQPLADLEKEEELIAA